MKSEIENTPISGKGSFPCLYKSTDSNLVVLFMSERTGVVVYPEEGKFIGDYSCNWVRCTDEEDWFLFTGTIKLSN